MRRNYTVRPDVGLALQILGVGAVYFVSVQLGLLVSPIRGQVSPLWPATGVALVALLLLGMRAAPGIMLGAIFVNWLSGAFVPALAISVGNTLAAVCAYVLLRRAGFRVELDRFRDGLALVFLGAFAGMLVSSSIGTAVLVANSTIPPHGFWPTWLVWWTGDAMGVLIFAPLLLVFVPYVIGAPASGWFRGVSLRRWVEAGILLAGAFIAMVLATRLLGVLFLGILFVGWAALRFQLVGTAPCALLVSAVAIDASVHEYGPFLGDPLVANMVTLQVFNGSVALVGLLLSVIVTERNCDRRDIERTCQRLLDVVNRLDQGSTVLAGELRQHGRQPDQSQHLGDDDSGGADRGDVDSGEADRDGDR